MRLLERIQYSKVPAIRKVDFVGPDTAGIVETYRPGRRYDLKTGPVAIRERVEFEFTGLSESVPDIDENGLPEGKRLK